MAPLKKLGSTLRELGDKLSPNSKRRISEESEAAQSQQSKQPKTLSPSPSGHQVGLGPSKATFPTAAMPSQLKNSASPNQESKQYVASSTSKGTSVPAGSTIDHPVDLTGSIPEYPVDLTGLSPTSSPESQFSQFSTNSLEHFNADMDSKAPRAVQIANDEQIARQLQELLNNNSSDATFFANDFQLPDTFPGPQYHGFDPREYRTHLQSLKCAGCGEKIACDWETVVKWTAKSLNSGFLHPYLQCDACKGWCCAGNCGFYHETMPKKCITQKSGLKVSWCCDNSRLFLIFVLACGPGAPQQDPAFAMPPNTSGILKRDTKTKSQSEAGPPSKSKPGPSHVQGGPDDLNADELLATAQKKLVKLRNPRAPSQLSKGTGYGGPEWSPKGAFFGFGGKEKEKPKPKPTSSHDEREAGKYYTALCTLLPSLSRDSAFSFDIDPPAAIAFFLARSPLLQKASEILRQTSIEEVAANQSLYSSLMDFLETMMAHPSAFLHLLYADHVVYADSEQLGPIMFWMPTVKDVFDVDDEKTKSLAKLVAKLADTCQYYMRTISTHLGHLNSNEGTLALELATRVIDVASQVEKTRKFSWAPYHPESAQPQVQSPTVITRSRSAKTAEMEAKGEEQAWHRENCVKDLPDELILENFHYANKARKMDNAKTARGRIKKLATQMTSLRSDLPEGIFVRHGSSRLDIMKVMIIGPADTPYENGLFEFDLFCDEEFPIKPPSMKFRTTGGGMVHFNPNLYSNGKVCLSLLGTWAGQNWIPDQSTILQVLVSIQGMILCSEPWYNEPGRETHLDTTASSTYNRTIWKHTVRTAIISWMTDRLAPPDKKGDKGKNVDTGKASAQTSSSSKQPMTAALMDTMAAQVATFHPLAPTLPATPSFNNAALPVGFPHNSINKPPTTMTGAPVGEYEAAAILPFSTALFPVGTPPYPMSTQHQGTPPYGRSTQNQGPAQYTTPPGQITSGTPQTPSAPQKPKMAPFGYPEHYYLDTWASAWPEHDLGVIPMFPGSTNGAPTRGQPLGNTVVDGKDDAIWGDVIRHHFERKGQLILGRAKKSPYQLDQATLKVLAEVLKKMGFVE